MGARRQLALAVAATLCAGCLVGVEVEDVSDPGPAFAEARRQAARVQGRPGAPETLKILVFDRNDGQLVRASVPFWVVEKMGDEEIDLDLGEEGERFRRRFRASDLQGAPLGPLVEVDEEDGDQVLVWLK